MAAKRVMQAAALAVVAGLLGLLIVRVIDSRRGANLVAQLRQGKKRPTPAFTLPVVWDRVDTWPARARRALADTRVTPAELRGYPIVINFWASWCVPCKREASRLAASARRHTGRVVFLAIDVQDFRSDARKFLKRFDTPYVSVRDGGGSTYGEYGLTGIPETYWVDAGGKIVAHYPGEVSPRQLEDGIADAVSG